MSGIGLELRTALLLPIPAPEGRNLIFCCPKDEHTIVYSSSLQVAKPRYFASCSLKLNKFGFCVGYRVIIR